MSTATTTKKSPETDGRKLRTNDSRKKIVDAYLALVKEGNVSPSAEEIATAANVGLRTVFRRFNEMELLHRELVIEVQARHLPKFLVPYIATHWREQLDELTTRRAQAYELLMPYRVAAKVQMHRSTFIKENMQRWTLLQEKQLESLLPFTAKQEPIIFSALAASMSFDNWIQIRNAQNLSAQQAEAVMSYMMESTLGKYQTVK